jgi:hypothetical protein
MVELGRMQWAWYVACVGGRRMHIWSGRKGLKTLDYRDTGRKLIKTGLTMDGSSPYINVWTGFIWLTIGIVGGFL